MAGSVGEDHDRSAAVGRQQKNAAELCDWRERTRNQEAGIQAESGSATANSLRSDPGLARRTVRALVRGYQGVLANPQAGLSALQSRVPGLDPALVAAQLSALLPAFRGAGGAVGVLDPRVLSAWARWDRQKPCASSWWLEAPPFCCGLVWHLWPARRPRWPARPRYCRMRFGPEHVQWERGISRLSRSTISVPRPYAPSHRIPAALAAAG